LLAEGTERDGLILESLAECQTTWIQIRGRVTHRLIWTYYVCFFHYTRGRKWTG